MREKIKFPVYAYEIETGDIELYQDINGLKLITEEFWDILEDDFKFWDGEGFRLFFDKNFLKEKNDTVQKSTESEAHLLKLYFLKYAQRNGVQGEEIDDINLMDIANYLKKE